MIKERCNNCGFDAYKGALQIHHKDLDHSNNNIDNLVVLCMGCHRKTHRQIPRMKKSSDYHRICLRLPEEYVKAMQDDVNQSWYANQSEAIRDALKLLYPNVLKKVN